MKPLCPTHNEQLQIHVQAGTHSWLAMESLLVQWELSDPRFLKAAGHRPLMRKYATRESMLAARDQLGQPCCRVGDWTFAQLLERSEWTSFSPKAAAQLRLQEAQYAKAVHP